MTISTVSFIANTLADLKTQLDAYLAPLINASSVFITGLDIILNDQDRRMGTQYQAVLSTNDDSATSIATPWTVELVSAANVSDLDAAFVTFYAANPTAFVTSARIISRITPSLLQQMVCWVLLNPTAGASANYTPL